ncbi:MAG: right-handed parallel beta-helix repeat-containing protein [Planctomycetota bacterium]|jgi:parallel beta-helix repeat protein
MLPLVLLALAAADPPVVIVDRDNVEITTSCTVRVEAPIVDGDGDGVIHVTSDGVTVDLAGTTLRGATEDRPADTYAGVGIRITAPGVVLRGARISGFKVGIYASGADDLVIEDCEVSGNFRQRLRSTPQAEDPSDWLWPHRNDDNEWLARYGAGIYVEDSDRVTVRRVKARRGQNGIVLDRVNASRIYDNDCSFLSGWGLALWRSSRNVISRNAFDFCVRGYSHGVYNRGQDSAGILMFEQCSRNIIAENSATHGGDGLFAFAGVEALGEVNPRDDLQWYKQRGNNNNLIISNDFSYAAAHGLEMTFSFGNRIFRNRLIGNAICGIWGGYSQESGIGWNDIEANGEMGYGDERGGVNIEHGRSNRIIFNNFKDNACGVFLWWDDDEALLATPWARINQPQSADNEITANSFDGGETAIILRQCDRTKCSNAFGDVAVELDADDRSRATLSFHALQKAGASKRRRSAPYPQAVGETRPVQARPELAGREHIIMTEWGPYDWQAPLLALVDKRPDRHAYRVLGHESVNLASLDAPPAVRLQQADEPPRLIVTTETQGALLPYTLTATTDSSVLKAAGALLPVEWEVRFFAYRTDPREDLAAWHREAAQGAVRCTAWALDFRFAGAGPGGLGLDPQVTQAALPADHFGTIAETTIAFPAGRWRIKTTSDDGIRVWLDEAPIIDDWTWHPPKTHAHDLVLSEPKAIPIRVEHFELDGYAVLSLEIEAVQE